MQYLGLGLYVVAEAFIFAPILIIANYYFEGPIITQAAVITLLLFGGLTATVFITKKDFSFLRGVLAVGAMVALGLIILSVLFGFTLGVVFSAAMIALAAGYILFHTSQVMAHYPPTHYVAAALALFSSVALLFWYVLRLLMSLSRD
jgi:FtsH-binding integral membrane protein